MGRNQVYARKSYARNSRFYNRERPSINGLGSGKGSFLGALLHPAPKVYVYVVLLLRFTRGVPSCVAKTCTVRPGFARVMGGAVGSISKLMFKGLCSIC